MTNNVFTGTLNLLRVLTHSLTPHSLSSVTVCVCVFSASAMAIFTVFGYLAFIVCYTPR